MVVGITGRAGSGKSFLEHYIRQHTDAHCIDLDKLGHKLLEQHDVQETLVALFGEVIRDGDTINRAELGTIVFNDDSALTQLNACMHPRMKDDVLATIKRTPNKTLCVIGALIQEIGLSDVCDIVVTIDAEDDDIRRVSPKQYAIMQRQRSRESYKKEADIVITNTYDEAFSEKIRQLVKNHFRITSTLDKMNGREE